MIKDINSKSIKRKKSLWLYEKEGCDKRKPKCYNRQKYSKEIKRFLRKKSNKQVKIRGKSDRKTAGREKIMGKKEETTDIIHYLYPQLIKVGIKIENTKQDVTNEKTGNLRGDLWISAYKQDSNNFWENILALIEAKHRKCVLGDKDWKDAMRQGEVKAKKQGLNFYIITNTKDLIRFYNAYTNEIIELDDKILTSFQSEDNLRLIQTQIGESNNKVYSKIRKSEFFLEKNFRKSLIRLSKVYRSCSIKKDDRIDPTVSFVILKYICEKEFEKRNLKKEVLLWDEYGNKTGNYKGDFISSSRDIFSGEYGREYEDFKDLIKLPEKLTNEHYKKIFKEFSQYHFHGCGFDVFGTIYEEFASQQKKKEFGEFYTRRHITKVICKLLLKDEIDVEKKIKIADPACGSGGFITEAFKILFDNYIRYGAKEKDILSKLKTETFWGFDNEPSSIARAKLNMFLVGDGHTHLYENDSLDGWNAKKEWREDYFDYVLTNPPYGIYDGEIPIENFDFTNESRYEMMFLEKIIKSVKVGGKIAVVIPDGVLESPSRANFRKKILEHCEVYAVVSLTKFAFAPYTKEKTYVMFMKKKPLSEISKMQKSPIWHFIVDYDGFANSDKRYPTPLHDDLPLLEENFLKGFVSKEVEGDIKVKCGSVDISKVNEKNYFNLLSEFHLRKEKIDFATESEFDEEFKKIKNDFKKILGEL